MTKVAIYARVSLDEQNKDSRQFQDPGNQLKPLREFCKSLGYEVVKEYTDKMSGANPARPSFRAMMADGLQRRFSGIVVWKLDRFSREGVIPTMSYIKRLKDRGIWLKSMTESWLDTSQEGITEIVLAIMSWAASEERKKISERTKAGIARRRSLGKWKGGRPKNELKPKQEVTVLKLQKEGKSALQISRIIKVSKYTLEKFLEKGGKKSTPKLA